MLSIAPCFVVNQPNSHKKILITGIFHTSAALLPHISYHKKNKVKSSLQIATAYYYYTNPIADK